MQIHEFNPEQAKKKCVWLLIGPRNTGKSVLLQDLLYHTRDHYDFGVAMTKTRSTVDSMRRILPARMIYGNGYDYDAGDKFLKVCRDMSNTGVVRDGVLILDDCMFDNKVMKTETQRDLHLNGRHYNTTIFNTTQYCMIIPSDIRSNVDYVLALRDNINVNKRRLYDYFYGLFSTYAEFDRVFSVCTQNYGALVIDRTRPTSSVSECIYHYTASPCIPSYRLGRSCYFRMSDRIDDINNNVQEADDENKVIIV